MGAIFAALAMHNGLFSIIGHCAVTIIKNYAMTFIKDYTMLEFLEYTMKTGLAKRIFLMK